jgi:hypothetical protein
MADSLLTEVVRGDHLLLYILCELRAEKGQSDDTYLVGPPLRYPYDQVETLKRCDRIR